MLNKQREIRDTNVRKMENFESFSTRFKKIDTTKYASKIKDITML